MTEEDDKRSSANIIYYGKEFHPYGENWVKNGLLHYVPLSIIVKVITNPKNVPDDLFVKHSQSLSKDKVVDIMMQIYNKGDNRIKQRIEKWVFAYRYHRKVVTEMPFLRRLDSFYMYLRTNPNYVIQVPPDAATKVAAHLTLVGIIDLAQVKSVLKSILCKRKTDWDVFDSLFNTWFESSSKSYGVSSKTIITPSAYLKLEITPPDTLSVEQALIKLRRVLSDNPRTESDAESKSSEGENTEEYTEEESESEYAPSDTPSDEESEPSEEEGEGESEPSDEESDKEPEEDESGEPSEDEPEDKPEDEDGEPEKDDDSKDDDSEEEDKEESDDDKDGDKDKESKSETEIAFGGSF